VSDALKFNRAPETINGRLAMLGFLRGAWLETQTAEPLAQQAVHSPVAVVAVVLLVTYSSLVPFLKGARLEAFGKALIPGSSVPILFCMACM
jgi:Chlorophyll A-B binding protein